jgi:uncharacterized protein (DUF305 family)
LRTRFASGEIDTEEYERSLAILDREPTTVQSGGARPKLLVAGLAAAALLVAGTGAAYASGGQVGSMMGTDDTGSAADASGMGSMMGGGGMSGGMMGGGQGGSMMGSFDEDEPFDLQFIDQMIMHHRGAIMSSQNMIAGSDRPELRQLAEDIETSQSEQIEQMQDMRERWYPDAGRTSGMMGGSMQKMMGEGQMQEMMGGDTTDAMFLRMMIPHHQMAVDMPQRALEGEAEHPELKELAEVIEEEQSAEIDLMQGYLEEIDQTTND